MVLKFGETLNCANSLVSGAYSISQANGEAAKTEATTQFISTALNTIFSVVCKAIEAQQETAENAKDSLDLKTSASEITSRTYAGAERIIARIEENGVNVQNLLDGLNQNIEQVQEFNKQLEEQRAIIDENKAIISNPEATREERKEALNNIKGAGKAISELESNVISYTEQANQIGEEIQVLNEENEILSAEGQEITLAGEAEMQEVLTEAGGEMTETVAETVARGGKDITTGTADIAAGTPMLSNLITAAEGEVLIQRGKDSIKAGGIRTTESAITGAEVLTTVRFAGSALEQINHLTSGIGAGYSNNSTLIGDAGNYWNGFIQTIGSWTEIAGAGEEIVVEAEEEIENLDNSDEESVSTSSGDNSEKFNTDRLKIEVQEV